MGLANNNLSTAYYNRLINIGLCLDKPTPIIQHHTCRSQDFNNPGYFKLWVGSAFNGQQLMNDSERLSNNYIFRELDNGNLEFVGEFDQLYLAEDNPWFQSGYGNSKYKDYYQYSRSKLVVSLEHNCQNGPVLEVGCGIGYVVDLLSKQFPTLTIDGMDISGVAIQRANETFPNNRFYECDISVLENAPQKQYEIVVLNQMLWYILDNLEDAISNCHKLIRDDGFLIISCGFLRGKQRYGADIVDGCDGLLMFMKDNYGDTFGLADVQYDHSDTYLLHDGLLLFNKLGA